MWPESGEQNKPLRTGLTTGSCATACSLAAATALLKNKRTEQVTITLPKGKQVEMAIVNYRETSSGIEASCIKDGGDDPDATHGATVWAAIKLTSAMGVTFNAGKGVGTVTREGLVLGVGEPAINPVPRQMVSEHLQALAKECRYEGGFDVTVGIENGEAIALKTMNGRLGILGGLSILGTTGIVRPFSCAAWIASIHQGIDVARANGFEHIAASTGNASEGAIATHYDLPDVALIEMGDFSGAVLKHLKKAPVKKLSICGGFGKITKLANGHMDLNSRVSSIDFEQIAQVAGQCGASKALQTEICEANTSMQALGLCQQQGIELGDAMCVAAQAFAQTVLPREIDVEVWAVDRQGRFVGSTAEPCGPASI